MLEGTRLFFALEVLGFLILRRVLAFCGMVVDWGKL